MAKIKLDKEERDILDSFERGEWRPVKNLKQEIQKHQEYARQTLKKDKRVNIRIPSSGFHPRFLTNFRQERLKMAFLTKR